MRLCKFGQNPPIDSGDRVQTRSYADGILTKSSMSSLRLGGGEGITIISFGQRGLDSQNPDQTAECSLRAVRSGSTQLELCDQDLTVCHAGKNCKPKSDCHQGIHCLPHLMHYLDILLKGNRSTLFFKMITVH